MRVFRSTEEVRAARLPSWQQEAVEEAVGTLERIFGPGFDPARGCVILVEPGDTPETVEPVTGLSILGKRLETAWRRHGCLVGLTLRGNAGDGETWICPEQEGYAPRLQELLRREL